MKEKLKKQIDIAAGRRKPELVLKNARIINVFSHEIMTGDIAIDDGTIVGIGQYEGVIECDIQGKYVAPGLIDGHVHIESSMVSPGEFARGIVPRGTTTIIADPHEIANVCGIDGIEYILRASENIPLNVYIMLPSCVPATAFETSGANLGIKELGQFIGQDRVLGLGELMDYPSVVSAEDTILDKIVMSKGKIIDGHGPNISGRELNAYAVAGVKTDHECSTIKEMKDRLNLGMYILIREGSAARNLETLIKGVTKENSRRCLFCTDDKHPEDILMGGHIDNNLRLAVKHGIHPITAIQMATINVAECYGLKNLGAIAPGYDADLIVLDNLEDFQVSMVFSKGIRVAEAQKPLFKIDNHDYSKVTNTINMRKIKKEDLEIKVKTDMVNVIKLLPHSLVTQKVERRINRKENVFQYNKEEDILKLAVIERHKATGNIGLGLVEGFKMKKAAIALTIAHDSHNIIVIGDNDEDILVAIREIEKVGGGITIASGGDILKTLSLPIGGLMSNATMEEVNFQLRDMLDIAYNKLGVNKNIDPFMTLSFLALPVIPEIKLTDMGLFNVSDFSFIELDITK